ncbi:MAG: hypothetical protein M1825_001338 [Sarcosagium campestre]|nr:MAG: hypothetical protein M1825_001338 [Sarcosagium campestre]
MEQPSTEAPVALFKKRSAKAKSNFRKRPATPPPASDSDLDEGDYTSSEEGAPGQRIKRRRKNHGVVTASSTTAKPANPTSLDALESTKFAADRSKTIQATNDATRQSNWYDEKATDALSSKNLLGTTRTSSVPSAGSLARSPNNGTIDSKGGDGNGNGNGNGSGRTYKGSANYQTFIQKNPDAPSRRVGPIKAPTNIRTITVTDFAPDVCKDYKQTGFCGFGDNCKYLHAREDYKHGWELDRDWEIGTKGKKVTGRTVASAANRKTRNGDNLNNVDAEDDAAAEEEADEDALLENIPFACILCKKPYTNPVITKCGHYFCEACALKRYRKSPSCAACGAGTGGVFNGAKNLKRLLEKKRERARLRREKEREEGLDVSGDDDDDDNDDDYDFDVDVNVNGGDGENNDRNGGDDDDV